MKDYKALLAKNKGPVNLKDFKGYKQIGKGNDGFIFQLTSDRCIKIFKNNQIKELELKAFQAGQTSSVIPRLYEEGENYIVMEYVKGMSLPQYLKKEKKFPEFIAEKILAMLVELKNIGFKRCDTEFRHILFNENMDIKVIDLKRAFDNDRSVPTKLLKDLKKKGYLDEFMQHVKNLNPSLYKEWKKYID